MNARNWTKKVRYYSNVTGINLLALLFISWALSPLFIHRVAAEDTSVASRKDIVTKIQEPKLIQGEPARLTIPGLYIDLPVVNGQYDPATNTWSLENLKAQFDIYSADPNNLAGETFLYGHNNYQTLGAIKSITPGTTAYLYTSNGHVFSYTFKDYSFVNPDDTTVLDYQGPPILVIQTCTGVWNETRGMFHFDFQRVES